MNLDTTTLAARLRTIAERPEADTLARLAQTLLADPTGCSRLSISDLADSAGVSESSVVRTAKALGLTGYRELRIALAELGTRAADSGTAAVIADIVLSDTTTDVLLKLAAEETVTIQETAALLEPATVERIADAIVQARRIDLVGVVASGLVAHDFAQKLSRIGLNARAHTDGHNARQAASLLGNTDVMIGISHTGTTDDVIGALELAAHHQATTVAITSNPRSALAHIAELQLITSASREAGIRPGALSSRTAQLFTVDAIFVAVLQRLDHSTRATLTASFDAVRPLKRGTLRSRNT